MMAARKGEQSRSKLNRFGWHRFGDGTRVTNFHMEHAMNQVLGLQHILLLSLIGELAGESSDMGISYWQISWLDRLDRGLLYSSGAAATFQRTLSHLTRTTYSTPAAYCII